MAPRRNTRRLFRARSGRHHRQQDLGAERQRRCRAGIPAGCFGSGDFQYSAETRPARITVDALAHEDAEVLWRSAMRSRVQSEKGIASSPELFLAIRGVPLPPLAEQRCGGARIEELVAHIPTKPVLLATKPPIEAQAFVRIGFGV